MLQKPKWSKLIKYAGSYIQFGCLDSSDRKLPRSELWALQPKSFAQPLWNRSEAFTVESFRIQTALIASKCMNGSRDMLNEDYKGGALQIFLPCKGSQNVYLLASFAPQITVIWVMIQKWHDLIQTLAAFEDVHGETKTADRSRSSAGRLRFHPRERPFPLFLCITNKEHPQWGHACKQH